MSDVIFAPDIYRAYNLDLRNLSDAEAAQHFAANAGERRVYGQTSSSQAFLSMRWLRGSGLEVGAGGHPTPLFGDAKAQLNDCDEALAFGGEHLDYRISIDSPEFREIGKTFDFTIACHVLEHADSFLRAIENLVAVTRKRGIVYLVLPDIDWLLDRTWLPYFDFEHHVTEYHEPLHFAKQHDDLYIKGWGNATLAFNEHAELSFEYKAALQTGYIPQSMRFMHHKHNYPFQDWIDMLLRARTFLGNTFRLMDARFGHERLDCHFILEVSG